MARKSIQERFWRNVDRSGECWLWTAGTNDSGYGQIKFDGWMQKAHRVAWQLTYGPIPNGNGYHGTCVCHRCDNPRCVRPEHLFIGTHGDNMADKKAKHRQIRNKGTANGRAQLTESEVVRIRADKRTVRAIAFDYGIGTSQVSRIRRGAQWVHTLTG